MRDHWHSFIPGAAPAYAAWLHDHGSLTRRIQQRCTQFQVGNVYTGLSMANHDEMQLLGMPRQQQLYTRDVFLYADKQPVVFAHSVVAAQHLRGAWHTLQHLGNRPLGALLFTHPLVRRAPLSFRALKPEHPLYRDAVKTLNAAPPRLWARRSVFTLQGAALLVTEVFLPNILKLSPGKK